jgi:succinate dehydrogenase / fumarate reductase cytochrome b subunit
MNRVPLHPHTSVGSKIVVAVTGLGLALFVVFHMVGNLQIFQGARAINGYAAFLRDMPILLWTARAGLLAFILFHLVIALKLARRNRDARPIGYAVRHYRQASLASRTMAVSGILLLLFIIFHLLHLTAGIIDPSFAGKLDVQGQRDVYTKMIHAFQNPLFVFVYLAAQIVLGLHLSHAVSSSLQTLGWEHPALNRIFKVTGPAVALIVVVGNTAIVLAVTLGIIR